MKCESMTFCEVPPEGQHFFIYFFPLRIPQTTPDMEEPKIFSIASRDFDNLMPFAFFFFKFLVKCPGHLLDTFTFLWEPLLAILIA